MSHRALSSLASFALLIAGLGVTVAHGRSSSLPVREVAQSVSNAEAPPPEPLPTAPASALALSRLLVRAGAARVSARPALRGPVAPPAARVLPAFGTYVYSVSGTEETTGLGKRAFPSEMTMTIHPLDGPSGSLVFDLAYSPQHEERQIVSFNAGAVDLTAESSSVTFTIKQTSEAAFVPPIAQVPLPLEVGAKRSGRTQARAADGSPLRIVDWTSEVIGRETITVAGQSVDTWVVRAARRSRPGTVDQEDRTRTYWYDPARALWVRWTEKLVTSKQYGPGVLSYTSETAVTLKREPG